MEKLLNQLKAHYPLSDVVAQRGDLAFITIPRDRALDLVDHLKRHHGFTHLVILTAVDWIEDGKFQLTYLLNNPATMDDVGVRVMIDREGASMESIHHLWITAATYQRELREMFGIDFPGSPRVDVPFILEGWKDLPPYRRDFDTRAYSERTFFPRPGRTTSDPATHMREKMYPTKGGGDNV